MGLFLSDTYLSCSYPVHVNNNHPVLPEFPFYLLLRPTLVTCCSPTQLGLCCQVPLAYCNLAYTVQLGNGRTHDMDPSHRGHIRACGTK